MLYSIRLRPLRSEDLETFDGNPDKLIEAPNQ